MKASGNEDFNDRVAITEPPASLERGAKPWKNGSTWWWWVPDLLGEGRRPSRLLRQACGCRGGSTDPRWGDGRQRGDHQGHARSGPLPDRIPTTAHLRSGYRPPSPGRYRPAPSPSGRRGPLDERLRTAEPGAPWHRAAGGHGAAGPGPDRRCHSVRGWTCAHLGGRRRPRCQRFTAIPSARDPLRRPRRARLRNGSGSRPAQAQPRRRGRRGGGL